MDDWEPIKFCQRKSAIEMMMHSQGLDPSVLNKKVIKAGSDTPCSPQHQTDVFPRGSSDDGWWDGWPEEEEDEEEEEEEEQKMTTKDSDDDDDINWETNTINLPPPPTRPVVNREPSYEEVMVLWRAAFRHEMLSLGYRGYITFKKRKPVEEAIEWPKTPFENFFKTENVETDGKFKWIIKNEQPVGSDGHKSY